MKVVIRCVQCSYTDQKVEEFLKMNPIGPCIINDNKDQFQDYMCPQCYHITNVMINTIKEQYET